MAEDKTVIEILGKKVVMSGNTYSDKPRPPKVFDDMVLREVGRIKVTVHLDSDNQLEGSRWKNNQGIADMVVNWIVFYDLGKRFQAIPKEQLHTLIVGAIHDSASADYWYTYEKQWQ